MVPVLRRAQLEELAKAWHMMGCEFELTETYTGKDRQMHVKVLCLGNMLPCLVDTPMGWGSCTRREWLLLQGAPVVPEKRRNTGKVSDLQGKLT